MPILWACGIAFVLVAASVLVHYELLRLTSRLIPVVSIPTRPKVLIVIAAVFTAHILEICLFAGAYAVMNRFRELGAIAGQFSGTGLDFFYFSIASYTTLGIGDLFPHGALRLIAGIESLTGFVLIGWSASFTYLAMEKFWIEHSERHHPRVRKD